MLTRVALIATALTAILGCPVLAEEAVKPRVAEVAQEIEALVEADWIERDLLFAAANVKPGEPVKVNARGVTTVEDASGAVDGIKNGRFGFHVAVGEKDPWWQVDLGVDQRLDRVVIHNRTDGNTAPRTRQIGIQVSRDADPDRFETVYRHDGTVFFGVKEDMPLVVRFDDKKVTARIVRLLVDGVCHLALDEVEVYAADDPKANIALGKPADQKSVSRHSVPGTAGQTPPPAESAAPKDGGFRLAHTRDVIQRACNLAARLRRGADPGRLDPLVAQIGKLDRRLAELEDQPVVSDQVRKGVYFEARRALRGIAFCNPLLDFEKL